MNYESTNLLHLTIARRKHFSVHNYLFKCGNFKIYPRRYRIAKHRWNTIIINDNEVLNSLSIVRDKRHDLARNSYIVRFIWVTSWKETKRCPGTCASRELQNSEKAEKRWSFTRKTLKSCEIRSYVSVYISEEIQFICRS